MGVEIETIPGAGSVLPLEPKGAQAGPSEPQPFRTLIDLGLLRRNVTSTPGDHLRYAPTGLGWAAVAGAAWWLLFRKSSAGED